MYFEFRENGTIAYCLDVKAWPELVYLVPPDNFNPDDLGSWKYLDGEFVYTPIQEPDTPHQKTDAERIDELEARLNAYEAAYVEGVNQA